MASSIQHTGYSLLSGSGTYDITFTGRVTRSLATGKITQFHNWCNTVTVYPSYYTKIIEEGSGREFINNSETGAPTLPVTVQSEINGSSVSQNLAPSSLKEPVKLYFKLKDGYSLPQGLSFQERSGRISGKPPDSVSSLPPNLINDQNKNIEMYLNGFGEFFNQPFNASSASLFGYAHAVIRYNYVSSC